MPITGDWNADRTDTIGVYDGATATVFLRNANSAGAADITFAYGPPGSGWKPLAGDWNGDAVETIGLYDPATATFSLRNAHSAGAADLTVTYGPAGAGWTPLAGDWTHAGADPVGVSNPGDWDGNGTDTWASYEPLKTLRRGRRSKARGEVRRAHLLAGSPLIEVLFRIK